MDKVLAKLTALAASIGAFSVRVGSSVNDAKLLIAEVAGAAATLTGVGSLTGWQYALIIGGVAVVLSVERQPGQQAALLRKALTAAKSAGKVQVAVDDVLKLL